MMKKLSKLALLAVAAAFLAAALPACSSGSSGSGGDDGDEAPEKEQTPSPTTAKSFTANFVGLAASEFGLDSIAKNSTTNLPGVTCEVEFADVTATLYSKGNGNLRVRGDKSDTVVTADSINYNGESISELTAETASVSIEALSRYISVPVGGAGTVTVSYKGTHKESDISGENKVRIAVLDASGNVLASKLVSPAESTTIDAQVSAATTVYVVCSRNGTLKANDSNNGTTGGIDVYSIEFIVKK